MMCDRCHEPIWPGEAYETHDMPSPSGAGRSMILHKELCKRPPTQTSPARMSSARRGEAVPHPRTGRP